MKTKTLIPLKLTLALTLLLTVTLLNHAPARAAQQTDEPVPVPTEPRSPARLEQTFGQLPLYFVENQGQLDERVAYYVQGHDKTIYFTPQGVTFALTAPLTPTLSLWEIASDPSLPLMEKSLKEKSTQRWVVKLDFVDANPDVQPIGQDKTEAIISYFKGSPDQWHAGLPTYARIVYPDLWPGIDLVYYGTVDQLKYEFVVHPGADPAQIRLAYRGATDVALNKSGQLEVITPIGGFTDDTPVAYQEIDGRRVPVSMAYRLLPVTSRDTQYRIRNTQYTFHIGDYDPNRPLILDPAVLVYCGYIGGLGNDDGYDIALDEAGSAYITGNTNSNETTFPVTVGPDLTHNGWGDAFVAKVNADGSGLVYASYIGGSDNDYGYGIAVDGTGNAYVTGYTKSDETTFPVTVGPDLTHNGSNDAFVAKVAATGSALVYAGYIGGADSDWGKGIAVDGAGNAYVTGDAWSDETTFPVAVGPDLTYNGGSNGDAFIAKVQVDGGGLVYAGYIGGAYGDWGSDITLDEAGSAYVTGHTGSDETTFPVTGGPDLTHNGGSDTFVAKVQVDGTGLVYAGYVGGSTNDYGHGIAVNGVGNAYVTGYTDSDETTFPVTVGPDLTYNGGATDAFVAKVQTDGARLVYAGYVGGANDDKSQGIAVDGAGNAYITGYTSSSATTFPVVVGPDLTYNGNVDAFVAKVQADGARLIYAGYIGGANEDRGYGIAVDGSGNAYVTGETESDEATFPVAGGPDLTHNDYIDAFIAKVSSGGGGYSVSGRVTDSNGSPIANVIITAGSEITAVTNASGVYTITDIITGTYTIMPNKASYTFAPASRTVSVPPDITGQHFVARSTSAIADPIQSTIIANPLLVEANGVTSSSITITLKNASGAPVPNKMVQLVSKRGSQDIIVQPTAPTDSTGMTVASVRSLVPGTLTMWGWVIGDGIRINTPVTVTFGTLAPVPDALRTKASSTIDLTHRTLDRMWDNTRAIVDEATYFRGAIGENSFKLGSDLVSGLVEAWGSWSDWHNSVPASRFTFPGWRTVWDSPAWTNPAVCEISSAFIKDATNGIAGEVEQRLARTALESGLYLLTAQKSDTCLGDLEDSLTDGWHISNLILAHLEQPLAEWPMKKLIDDERAFLQAQLDRVNTIRIPPLSQAQVDAYATDLTARGNALSVFSNRLQDARWTLESVHQANAVDPVGGQVLQTILRLSAKGLATYAFDGAGRLLVGGSLTAFDTYMNTNALSESILMAGLANGTIVKTAPESAQGAVDTITAGLEQMMRGQAPHTPQGALSNVQHFSAGSGWGPFWKEQASYSTMTVHNTRDNPATFHIVSRYLAQTTRLGVPWATLWMNAEAMPVTLESGESRTVRVDYRTGSLGHSPREQQNIPPWGNVPASSISVDLLGINDSGVFHLDHNWSEWSPSRVSSTGQLLTFARAGSGSALSIPTIDEPLVTFVGGNQAQTYQTGLLWVNNPFTSSTTVTVTQPVLADMTPCDLGTGSLSGDRIVWTARVAPLDTLMFTHTFNISGTPGTTITLPAAELAMQSPNDGVLIDTADAVAFMIPWHISISRRTPDWIAPGSAASIIVTATNQLTVPLEGSLTLSVTTQAGKSVFTNTQSLLVNGQQTQTLSYNLPVTLSIGDYRAIGVLEARDATGVMFDDPFSIGAPPPILMTTVSPAALDGTAEPGSLLTYSVWVTNTANVQLTSVKISNTLPTDINIISGTISDRGVRTGDSVCWNIGELAPGIGHALTYVISVPEDYVSDDQGRYIQSGATLTSLESPRTTGQSITLLVIKPESFNYFYLPLLIRNYSPPVPKGTTPSLP